MDRGPPATYWVRISEISGRRTTVFFFFFFLSLSLFSGLYAPCLRASHLSGSNSFESRWEEDEVIHDPILGLILSGPSCSPLTPPRFDSERGGTFSPLSLDSSTSRSGSPIRERRAITSKTQIFPTAAQSTHFPRYVSVLRGRPCYRQRSSSVRSYCVSLAPPHFPRVRKTSASTHYSVQGLVRSKLSTRILTSDELYVFQVPFYPWESFRAVRAVPHTPLSSSSLSCPSGPYSPLPGAYLIPISQYAAFRFRNRHPTGRPIPALPPIVDPRSASRRCV